MSCGRLWMTGNEQSGWRWMLSHAPIRLPYYDRSGKSAQHVNSLPPCIASVPFAIAISGINTVALPTSGIGQSRRLTSYPKLHVLTTGIAVGEKNLVAKVGESHWRDLEFHPSLQRFSPS